MLIWVNTAISVKYNSDDVLNVNIAKEANNDDGGHIRFLFGLFVGWFVLFW